MKFLVKVKVNRIKLKEFGEILQKNGLDRSCIKGETFCLNEDPAIGYSIWETKDKKEFEEKFKIWKEFYSEIEVKEVIYPYEAMMKLIEA